jgi:hypothetical protein
MVSALKLLYDEPLSNFAFNFSLRRCSTGGPPPLPPLLKFLNEYPDLFKEEILGRLDPGRAGYFLLHEYFTICISILQ